jgi:hypothetical protein
MFLSKEAGHYEKYLETQKKVAPEYKDKVWARIWTSEYL